MKETCESIFIAVLFVHICIYTYALAAEGFPLLILFPTTLARPLAFTLLPVDQQQ